MDWDADNVVIDMVLPSMHEALQRLTTCPLYREASILYRGVGGKTGYQEVIGAPQFPIRPFLS